MQLKWRIQYYCFLLIINTEVRPIAIKSMVAWLVRSLIKFFVLPLSVYILPKSIQHWMLRLIMWTQQIVPIYFLSGRKVVKIITIHTEGWIFYHPFDLFGSTFGGQNWQINPTPCSILYLARIYSTWPCPSKYILCSSFRRFLKSRTSLSYFSRDSTLIPPIENTLMNSESANDCRTRFSGSPITINEQPSSFAISKYHNKGGFSNKKKGTF